jgi:hypothetical protein
MEDKDKEFDESKKTLETELRIDDIANDVLSGRRRMQICKKYADEWNVSYRQIDWYLSEARKKILESQPDSEIAEKVKIRLAEYDKLHQLALSENQYGVARSILRDKSELEGLLVQRTDINIKASVVTKQEIKLSDGTVLEI